MPTPEETAAGVAVNVSIARIEAQLDALKTQLDHSDRNAAQLVKLFDERFTFRFDSLEKRLDVMDSQRDQARLETGQKLEGVERELSERYDRLDARVSRIENFNARLVGVAIGASLLTSGATAAFLRALGS